jgi:L-cysteine desulfidase
MITIPISTPRAIRPAGSRKSGLPPAAGCADPLALGLATATTDRAADGDGAALDGAAVEGTALRDALAVAVGVAVALAEAGAVALGSAEVLAVGAGDGVVVLVPSDAHARESLTPGADAHTDRAGVTHELPSAAVRESDTRANG